MKLSLTTEIVFKMTALTIPQRDTKLLDLAEDASDRDPPSANYLVYGTHKNTPPGFAEQVGKKSPVFLVDQLLNSTLRGLHERC